MTIEKIRTYLKRLAPVAVAATMLATAGVAAAETQSDCCALGAPCCHPGAPCCAHGNQP